MIKKKSTVTLINRTFFIIFSIVPAQCYSHSSFVPVQLFDIIHQYIKNRRKIWYSCFSCAECQENKLNQNEFLCNDISV